MATSKPARPGLANPRGKLPHGRRSTDTPAPKASQGFCGDTGGPLGWCDSGAGVRPSFNDTLHIMRFAPMVKEEVQMFLDIGILAASRPKSMKVIFGEHGEEFERGKRFASVCDLQNAISDPSMVGTLVVAHGAPSGKIWEVAPDPHKKRGRSMCPDGFADEKFGCSWTLCARPRYMKRPERVWLLGCNVGALKARWAATFGIEMAELYAPSQFSAGDDRCIAEGTCEATIPKLQEVLDWLRSRKRM